LGRVTVASISRRGSDERRGGSGLAAPSRTVNPMLPLSHGLPARRFAHIGGFVFGWLVARALLDSERRRTDAAARPSALTPF
jgi:hypothetical protein